MSKDKKIPISEFISDKKLNKVFEIIKKSDDIEMNYDRIEMLLDDDFKVKDLGTNRIVFTHKKKKYKDYIFKVAGDPHGIEANFREFYNGDLDKHLTFSYSISKNGVFVVQEKVTRMTKDLMKENKKNVRDMLNGLSKKILLVDCKMTNFKNFGIRKNGKVCLLDHGDTVPLPKYQGNEIINVEEESYVSLKCKRMSEASADPKKLKQCGGKLKYSKNFDSFICDKCESISAIHEAYREFYGDKRAGSGKGSGLMLDKDFDPDEWKTHIEKYCIETMSHANINNKGDSTMKTKRINGKDACQVKGFWLPAPETQIQITMYNSARMNKTSPVEYLNAIGIENIDDYKVRPVDHHNHHDSDSTNRSSANPLEVAANKIIEAAKATGNFETQIPYAQAAQICPNIDFGNMRNVGIIRSIMAKDEQTAGVIYTEDYFSVRILDMGNRKNDRKFEKKITSPVIPSMVEKKKVETEDDSSQVVTSPVIPPIVEKKERSFNLNEARNFDETKYIDEYAAKNNSRIVKDEENEDEVPPPTGLSFTEDDVENATTIFNNVESVVIGRYAIPMLVVAQYYNESSGLFELPNGKMKALLKSHNLSPKKYKIDKVSSIDDNVEENDIKPDTEESSEVSENNVSDTEILIDLDIDDYDQMLELCSAVNSFAREYGYKDSAGYCYISPVDVVTEAFINLGIDTEKDVYFTRRNIDCETYDTIEITVSPQQMNNLYKLFNDIYRKYVSYGSEFFLEESISIDYQHAKLGFMLSEFRNIITDSNNLYIRDKKEYSENRYHCGIPFNLLSELGENDIYDKLDDFFISLYECTSDNKIRRAALVSCSDADELDIINNYLDTKDEFFSYDSHAELISSFTHEKIHNLITASVDYVKYIRESSIYVEHREYLEDGFYALKDLEAAYGIDLGPDENYVNDDDDDVDSEISSDEYNNPNNNDEEEIDLTTPELIEVLKNLTNSINSNNELLSSSISIHDVSVEMLKNIGEKLNMIEDSIVNAECGSPENSKDYTPVENAKEYSEDGNTSYERVSLNYNATRDGNGKILASFDIDDIKDTLFAVSGSDKLLCMDLHSLVTAALIEAEDEYINVAAFKTSAV